MQHQKRICTTLNLTNPSKAKVWNLGLDINAQFSVPCCQTVTCSILPAMIEGLGGCNLVNITGVCTDAVTVGLSITGWTSNVTCVNLYYAKTLFYLHHSLCQFRIIVFHKVVQQLVWDMIGIFVHVFWKHFFSVVKDLLKSVKIQQKLSQNSTPRFFVTECIVPCGIHSFGETCFLAPWLCWTCNLYLSHLCKITCM